MSKKTTYFYITISFVFISNCFAAFDLPYKEGELLVRFAPKTDGKQMMATEQSQVLTSIGGGTIKRSFKIVPGLTLVKLPENSSVEKALPSFRTSGKFLYALPNYRAKVLLNTPNDTYFNDLWGMSKINAPQAWDMVTDSNIIVAVIDTGVDYTHEDLAANMWKNQAELNGAPNVDDDNNGYIDDIYGYDFVNNDDDPMDDAGHGTHCAGIIGAIGNNNRGVAGVCWHVKIMALKWIDAYGYGNIADAISCIDYAVSKGVKILNNSWHWPPGDYPPLREEIEAAAAEGVLFVASAGNGGEDQLGDDNDDYPMYPANYDCNNIISVMATDRYDYPAYFSNYGATTVDLAAPGVGILSTLPGNTYEFYDGTSMAAPHVAGACALVWAAKPWLTHLQVKDTIMQSVDHLASLDGLCVTGGRLNLYEALLAVSPICLTKTDNAPSSGVKPGDRLTYTISYNYPAPGQDPLTNIVLTDYLPAEVLHTNVVPDHNGYIDGKFLA